MGSDITVRVDESVVNVRVGAIITRDDCVLMVKNDRDNYYYSVGGRIRIGETSEEAVIREVYEELGVQMEIDRLGFIHENYFRGTLGNNTDREIYEISFYYYMKVPEDFAPVCHSVTEDGITEYIEWVPYTASETIYPAFFRTELKEPVRYVRHIITDER